MNQWLKDQFPTLIVIVLAVLILIMIFRKKDDNGTQLTKYQIEEIQKDNVRLKKDNDSMKIILSVPSDTIDVQQEAIIDKLFQDNDKILYEIRKKNNAALDTAGSDELKRRYSELKRY